MKVLSVALLISSLMFGGQHSEVRAQEQFTATHYGFEYNGRRMGCGDIYHSYDASIAAVALSIDKEWPCGTQLEVIGPAGSIVVTRTDSCPGCSRNMIDLSESGIELVCGGIFTCNVLVRQLD